jgi:hypothetical protein
LPGHGKANAAAAVLVATSDQELSGKYRLYESAFKQAGTSNPQR